MSRFYEVLKQAGGANATGDDRPDALWPVALDESATAQAGTVASADPESATDWAAAVAERMVPIAAADGRAARGPLQALRAVMRVDPKARLLPNTEDVTIIEHYRRLRTKLVQEHEAKPFRTLLVTSAGPQEGKTVTTLNIALSFAMLSQFKVLVVDADLRRGSLGKWLGVEDRPGLSNLIEGSATIEDVVLKCDDIPIHFVVSGTSKRPAAELLIKDELSSHLRKLASHFDLVLVDSPPTNLITDAQLLARACDAVLLVARAFTTTQKALKAAVQELQQHRIVGTVLNAAARTRVPRRYREYYHRDHA